MRWPWGRKKKAQKAPYVGKHESSEPRRCGKKWYTEGHASAHTLHRCVLLPGHPGDCVCYNWSCSARHR